MYFITSCLKATVTCRRLTIFAINEINGDERALNYILKLMETKKTTTLLGTATIRVLLIFFSNSTLYCYHSSSTVTIRATATIQAYKLNKLKL